MTIRPVWSCCWALLAIAPSATSAWAQATVRPPDLVVTRLQGTTASSASPTSDRTPVSAPDISPLVITRLDDRQAAASLDGPRRVTMSVSRPMPIGDLLLLLVNGTPLSLVADNDVGGTFTGDLKDLTMRQALEAVLFPRGLDYDLQGTLIRVSARRTSTRFFAINYVNVRRTLQRGMPSPPSNDASAPVATASSSDLYDEIERGVQSLLSASGRVHVDRTAGLVHVTDFAERLDQVGLYLEAVQVRSVRQVRIDAQVLSVTLWPGHAGSIDWTRAAVRNASTAHVSSGLGPNGLSVSDVNALTKALAEQGRVTKIAVPHIVAMNNEPAVVRVGRELVISDGLSSAGRGESRASTRDGLTLTVLAQVSADDFIQLHVSPTYATDGGDARDRERSGIPMVGVNGADTLMRVRDGETIVLAGFLSAAEKSKPRTGLGRLFRAEARSTVTSELVVLLTPHILKPAVSLNE